ncbi:MAG: methyltransferase domain-containing protein [Deltaproteobacteria bacterium]|nr:methyltransferase domain-containing protein [Deltaproteobacteria bacterium]
MSNGIRERVFAFNQTARDAWVALRAAEVAAGSRVLDVGAGPCPYRSLFSHCEYRAHDFAQLPPDLSGGYGRLDYVSDILRLPVEDGSFDVVLCTEVLEHVPDPEGAVRELARVLRHGGTLLLTAPLGSGLHQQPYHFFGGFTPHWYREFLPRAGFGDLAIEPNGGFFAHFGQEAQRFEKMLRPEWRHPRTWTRAPVWLCSAPIARIAVPLLCYWLDPGDTERHFTVGYHVRAVRGAST